MASRMLAMACSRVSPWLMAPRSSMHWAEYPPSASSLRITVNFRPFTSTTNCTNNIQRLNSYKLS